MPPEVVAAMASDGDYAKRHLLNPVLLRVLGGLTGQRVLDAGCGNGYLSRLLAARGVRVVGVEPAQPLYDFAVAAERDRPQGIEYVQADLCALPDLGAPFDAAVASMVLCSVPDWVGAMRACVRALKPGGLFVFTVNHPCFEQLYATWRRFGEYRTGRYLAEYDIEGPYATDRHRTLSSYLNTAISLGCVITELVEPGLTDDEEIEVYRYLPNFLIVVCRSLVEPGMTK
jgi:SAM-dependent methyltransferase